LGSKIIKGAKDLQDEILIKIKCGKTVITSGKPKVKTHQENKSFI
jgi:hypothetical protein